MEFQIDWEATLKGQLKVNALSEGEAQGIVKNLLGTSLSTAVILHPVNVNIKVNLVRPGNGIVTARDIPKISNRAERRRG